MYTIDFSPKAQEDLAKLKANEPKFFDKAVKVLLLSAWGHYDDK